MCYGQLGRRSLHLWKMVQEKPYSISSPRVQLIFGWGWFLGIDSQVLSPFCASEGACPCCQWAFRQVLRVRSLQCTPKLKGKGQGWHHLQVVPRKNRRLLTKEGGANVGQAYRAEVSVVKLLTQWVLDKTSQPWLPDSCMFLNRTSTEYIRLPNKVWLILGLLSHFPKGWPYTMEDIHSSQRIHTNKKWR
jgi:hypothetical protein